jgi:hypothetical protein
MPTVKWCTRVLLHVITRYICIGTIMSQNKACAMMMVCDCCTSGIIVRQVFPMSGAAGLLQPDDVILEIDGVPVACDGSVQLRRGQRISHSYLASR